MPAAGTGEKIMWGLLILLAGGYMLGTWLNRRRSQGYGRWLEPAVKLVGGKAQWKWVGSISSGAQITVSAAAAPFRGLQFTYLLLTRELLPLWGVELLRGKRDMLVIRANLQTEPNTEIEVVPAKGRLRKAVDAQAGDSPWQWLAAPAGLGLAVRGNTAGPLQAAVAKFLDQYAPVVQRLSLRDRQPNLILFLNIDGIEHRPSADLMQAVRQVARAALRQ